MKPVKVLPGLVLTCLVGVASAAPLAETPRAFDPISRTASAITGPVIASTERIIFGNGAMLELVLIEDEPQGRWSLISDAPGETQIFALSGEDPELLNGNSFCGPEAPRFMSVHQRQFMRGWALEIAIFRGPEARGGIDTGTLCGTYNFAMDAAVLRESGPDNAGDAAARREQGDWRVTRRTNPIDDSPTVVLSLAAETGLSRWGDPIIFYARCQSNTTEVYVHWDTYVGDDSRSAYSTWKNVTVRIGSRPAETQRWSVSTSNDATFAPYWAGDLLKDMLGADRLVLQMTPYGESPITAEFNTSGLHVVLEDLAKTCNWSY